MANNYFDEKKVTNWIKEYQTSAIREHNEDGDEIVVWKDEKLEHKITLEIIKIVKAIIQVYKYYVFEPYDDCLQHGLINCYTNYMKWTPEKGTAFNFFSIISKRSLLNYTDRRKKHRNLQDIDDQLDITSDCFYDFDVFIDEMKDTLFSIINENYIGKKRKLYLKITIVLCDYLEKTKKYVNKTDFYSWARSYGIRSIDVREFIKEMSNTEHSLFDDLNVF